MMSSKTCAIGLYKYFSGDIGAEDFRKFYEQSNSIFKNLGINTMQNWASHIRYFALDQN